VRFPEKDIDPNAPFNDERSFDGFDGQFSYDAYGNIDPGTQPSNTRRYAWLAAELDVDVELQYNRCTLLRPDPGRWIQRGSLGTMRARSICILTSPPPSCIPIRARTANNAESPLLSIRRQQPTGQSGAAVQLLRTVSNRVPMNPADPFCMPSTASYWMPIARRISNVTRRLAKCKVVPRFFHTDIASSLTRLDGENEMRRKTKKRKTCACNP